MSYFLTKFSRNYALYWLIFLPCVYFSSIYPSMLAVFSKSVVLRMKVLINKHPEHKEKTSLFSKEKNLQSRTVNCAACSQGRTQGGVGVKPPPWICYVTKTLLLMQKEFVYVFVHFLLVWCQLNAKTTEWFCMKISRNTVNGPKRNNYILVGIWVIACIQERSHHFLQTSRRLRIFMLVLRDSPLYS